MKKIVQRDAGVLRDTAKEVPVQEITSAKIRKIIREMKEALASQDDGVAIAAPQIDYSLRIFIVSGKIKPIIKKSKKIGGDIEILEEKDIDTVYINPVIKKLSKEKKSVEEGCLSVRYLYGKVDRSTKATIEAYDEYGKKFTKGSTGLLAQIFQHETDHLNGVLFIDTAKDLEEMPPTKIHGDE